MNCDTCKEKSGAFKLLSSDEVEKITMGANSLIYTANDLIFKQGTPISHIMYLRRGCVKLERKNNKRTNDVIQILVAPVFINLSQHFNDITHNYSAVALNHCEICYISKERFDDTILNNTEFSHSVLGSVCKAEIERANISNNLLRRRALGRIAYILLYFSEEVFKNRTFNLPLSNTDLANLLGISRKSFIKFFADLQGDRLIEVHDSTIEIVRDDLLAKCL